MKNYYSLTQYIFAIILMVLIARLEIMYLKDNFSVCTLSNVKNSSFAIEPEAPINIEDPPFYSEPLPLNALSVQQVIENGKDIPIKFIYNNPDWMRPAYKYYWHSKYGRWSYVPNRIHYAMHRVFSTYATASIYYDFEHDLGIAEEVEDFEKYESASPYDYLQVVVMNTLIEKITTLENQIVIVGKPQRTGLQAIIIPTDAIHPTKDTNNILIQLVTPDGFEIDYTTEVLVHSN